VGTPTREEFRAFRAQRPDAMGVHDDMRTEYGPVGPLFPAVHGADGRPTKETIEAYEELRGVCASRSAVGSVWTVYEETADSAVTRRDRVYARNKLELNSHSDRIKVLGWVVTAKASGPVYQVYLLDRDEL